MEARPPFIVNQSLVLVPRDAPVRPKACAPIRTKAYPSRFRRKKGYRGKTAQACNADYASMPDEF